MLKKLFIAQSVANSTLPVLYHGLTDILRGWVAWHLLVTVTYSPTPIQKKKKKKRQIARSHHTHLLLIQKFVSLDKKNKINAVCADRTHGLQITTEVRLQSDALPAELTPLMKILKLEGFRYYAQF